MIVLALDIFTRDNVRIFFILTTEARDPYIA